ncbi:MAG: hypothetical protein RIS70_220, partial [Planctomycetota bacterium]
AGKRQEPSPAIFYFQDTHVFDSRIDSKTHTICLA